MIPVYKILRSHSFKGNGILIGNLNDKIFSKHLGSFLRVMLHFKPMGMVFFQLGALVWSPQSTLWNGGGNFLVSWKVFFYYRNGKRIERRRKHSEGWEMMQKGEEKALNLIMGWWVQTPPLLVSSRVTRMHVGSQDLLSQCWCPPLRLPYCLRDERRAQIRREMLETDRELSRRKTH